jgi:hypothetical protein
MTPFHKVKNVALLIFISLFSLINFAHSANFIIPELCKGVATGDGFVNPVNEFKPEVTITYNDGKSYVPPQSVDLNNSSGRWQVTFFSPKTDTYLLYATYTPFLPSYVATNDLPGGRLYIYTLPDADYLTTYPSGYKLYDTANLTFTHDKVPVANGFVEMAPEFSGSSPYTMALDGEGKAQVNCFMSFKGGNPYTLYSSEHEYLEEGVVTMKSDSTLNIETTSSGDNP